VETSGKSETEQGGDNREPKGDSVQSIPLSTAGHGYFEESETVGEFGSFGAMGSAL